MEKQPLVSVIIPVYNVEAYLNRCVDSILTQTYSNLEVILVDDGTKDASDRICDDYAARDSRVRVIHKENGGLSTARNAGMDIARGDYLSFVDSDDWLAPETYEHLLSLMQKYDASIACMGNNDVSERTGKITLALCPEKEEGITGEELVRRMFRWDGIDCAACDKVFRRDLFDGIRFPVGKVCEDIAIMYRVVLRAERAAMCDKPFYFYYHHPNSISSSALSDKTFHYYEHTGIILQDIRQNHPVLEPEARFLRVRSLVYSLQCLNLAEASDREKYREIYAAASRELRQNIGFMIKSGFFTKKEIVINTLSALGLYRVLRRIYHRK